MTCARRSISGCPLEKQHASAAWRSSEPRPDRACAGDGAVPPDGTPSRDAADRHRSADYRRNPTTSAVRAKRSNSKGGDEGGADEHESVLAGSNGQTRPDDGDRHGARREDDQLQALNGPRERQRMGSRRIAQRGDRYPGLERVRRLMRGARKERPEVARREGRRERQQNQRHERQRAHPRHGNGREGARPGPSVPSARCRAERDKRLVFTENRESGPRQPSGPNRQ